MTDSTDTSTWVVYLLLCADNSLYTGITTDVNRRLEEHNGETLGARYTRARQPVQLVYQEACSNRSTAAKREAKIKRLSRKQKIALLKDSQDHA